MARILAIDYGLKRTGIAVTDPLQIIATALQTVQTAGLMNFLGDYFKKEHVESVIVGEPKNMDNTPSEISKDVESFISELKKKFPDKKIIRVDERFTSKIAQQTIFNSGLNKKARRDKSLIDKISAVVILQSYLASIQ
ncbi:MAG TPA: Holliday junction resolvase RuvX [Chitinophagales bacterium]|nr:Holliday junction resolvase RuvX [Chitinophagales bacterium]